MPTEQLKTTETKTELEQYLSSLSPKEIQGYNIAKSHLGMTYQYDKTIGFLAWKQKQTFADKN